MAASTRHAESRGFPASDLGHSRCTVAAVRRTKVPRACGPAVVLAALFAAACHSPVAPTAATDGSRQRLPPPFSGAPIGVWKGTFRLTGCSTGFFVPVADECVNSFVFRAMAVGSKYEGSLELNDLASVDVIGERRSDGAVTFTGERVGPLYALSIRVNQLVLETDAVTGLQGTFDGVIGFPDLTRHLTGTVLSASLIRSLEDSVNGAYEGLGRLRSCTGTCSSVGAEAVPIEFTIGQSNPNTVAGFVNAAPFHIIVPLSGSVSGRTLTLAGQLALQSTAIGVVRIDAFTVTIDPLGRVRGGYAYVEDYRTDLQFLPHVQSTWQVELVNVVRDVD